ncbi:ribonuclease h2, subunit b [Trichoderma arundinaceum]|uniref:Ribonuclease H2 subunit B n=1 Tax=Trichoderma arundinaceum TaxID=490622 RepID=A0A395NLY7_TRIAR|nr:ribonuclease h2, subunit b [Trichoderma arundinaceum]
MARTRSTKPSTAASTTDSESSKSKSKITLAPTTGEPPKVFILPSRATSNARIVTLPNPRSSQPSRYLVCPETGIYEFTKVAAPKTVPRSWLIEAAPASKEAKIGDGAGSGAQVTMGSELFVATTLDPLFLVLPALADVKASKGSDEPKRLFLSSDDHLDKLPQESSHLSEIMRWDGTRRLIESRMGAICDTVEAGDESMFRLNEAKLLDAIFKKAKKLSENGLPPSMEEKFVKKVLEAPLMHRVVRTAESQVNNSTDSGASTPQPDSATSQSTVSTADTDASSASQASTAATSTAEEQAEESFVSALEASPEVVKQQRLKTAFGFICASYVTPALADNLQRGFSGAGGLVDFSLLNDYLASLEKLRSETMAVRAQDYSRKRNLDEEEDEARMEKKRKMEEEKKKKASESRAVRELKKVNTSGMKKLSHFFQKK